MAEEPLSPLPARAYLLMDATTGQVLVEREGHAQLEMASTTKIMTAILALERGKPDDIVTAGQKPYDTGGSTIYLDLGEQQTLSNLLLALMLESANDVAVAIAEHLAGSEEQFAEWMNDKARAVGATHTHFVNSHGLHDPNHYTTAYDLALIARYALRNQKFRELIMVEEVVIPGFRQNPPRKLYNHNRLLGYYEGNTGVKNGYTEEAGLTNVASAKRGDTELIAVVLGAENRLWTSSMALLDYGFSHFATVPVVKKGEPVADVPLGANVMVKALAAEDLYVSMPLGARPNKQAVLDPGLNAPLEAGARVGRLEAMDGGKPVGQVELVISEAVGARAPSSAAETVASPYNTHMMAMAVLAVAWLLVAAQRRRLRRHR